MSNNFLLSNELGCSSFELKKTTKGYTWCIKVYNNDLEAGYEMVKRLDEKASKEYGIKDEN